MLEDDLRALRIEHDALHAWVCSFAPDGFPVDYRTASGDAPGCGTVTYLRQAAGPAGPRHARPRRSRGAQRHAG